MSMCCSDIDMFTLTFSVVPPRCCTCVLMLDDNLYRPFHHSPTIQLYSACVPGDFLDLPNASLNMQMMSRAASGVSTETR